MKDKIFGPNDVPLRASTVHISIPGEELPSEIAALWDCVLSVSAISLFSCFLKSRSIIMTVC